MPHNIEHKGEGDYNKQSAYSLCACADVATFIPSTVSLNEVKVGYRFPSILHMGSDQADQLNPAEPDGFGAFLKAAFLSSLYGSDSASEIAAAVRIHAGW